VTVMAVAKEAPMATHDRVHRDRDAREEGAHLVREVPRARGLDHQVQVVLLHGVMQDAHALALAARDLLPDRRTDALRSKARPAHDAPNGHVHWMIRIVDRACGMRHESDALRRRSPAERHELPPHAPALPRLLRERQGELRGRRCFHGGKPSTTRTSGNSA